MSRSGDGNKPRILGSLASFFLGVDTVSLLANVHLRKKAELSFLKNQPPLEMTRYNIVIFLVGVLE